MLTAIVYISGILGIIASIIEILQFFKILNSKHKFVLFLAVIVTTTICFSIYYTIDTRQENQRIEALRTDFIKKDAKSIVDGIVISGWEESGDYLGYLIQITGFYNRHKDNYSVEFQTYQKQLDSWTSFFEKSRQGNKFYQGYSSELSELKGLVTSGRDNLEKISSDK